MQKLTKVPHFQDILAKHPKLKAIFFDMDGTLLNSEFLHAKATQEILSPYYANFQGSAEEAREISEKCNGLSDAQLMEFLTPLCNIDISLEEFIDEKLLRFQALLSTTDSQLLITDEMIELIKAIKTSNLKLALVTSSERSVVELLMEKLKLTQYFDLILTRNETLVTKPSPEPYLMAMERLLVTPTDSLIFEDSAVGIAAASSSGAHFYQVRWYETLVPTL